MTSYSPNVNDIESLRPSPQPPAPTERDTTNLFMRVLRMAWTALVGLWKYFVGVALCSTGPIASVVVLGWVYRVMQRSAHKYWFKRSPLANTHANFNEFAQANEQFAAQDKWPNWFMRHNVRTRMNACVNGDSFRRTALCALSVPVHSLWLNFKRGVGAIAATWVLTLPACALWLFSWYAGWNNSFFKVYEQAWVGPTVGISGIVLFIAAMLYVPAAQARHAVTGNWRAFFDFRIVWRIIRQQWWQCAALAGLYALLSIPVMVLMMLPFTFEMSVENYYELTDAELVQMANQHFFGACLIVFPIFLLLRWCATRIYAAGLVKCIASGNVEIDRLREEDRQALGTFDLLHLREDVPRHIVIKSAFWTASRMGRAAAVVCAALLWFAFVAQIYIAQFFNYQMAQGWLNQPLVQLPWFKYLPGHLAG